MIRHTKFILCSTVIMAVLVVFSFGAAPKAGKKVAPKIPKATPVTEALGLFKYKTGKLGNPKLEKDGLYFGDFKINNTFNVVDELQSEKNCAATIFMKDGMNFKRVSSNIRISGASRAVGSMLELGGKPYLALSKGEPYTGVVDIGGKAYDAGYQPIKDADGKVVGAYFVGFLKESVGATPESKKDVSATGTKKK